MTAWRTVRRTPRQTASCLVAALLVGAPPALRAQATGDDAVTSYVDRSAPARRSVASDTARPQPGDVVRLRIWREPDLSGDYPVAATGEVTLPRLGPVRVVDLPADALRARLVASYVRFLREPAVDVTLLRRVRVAGAVRNPGLFTVDATVGVAELLALAGGVTSDGDGGRLFLARGGQAATRLPRAARASGLALRSGDQIEVGQRPWAARNAAVVGAVIGSTAFLISSLRR